MGELKPCPFCGGSEVRTMQCVRSERLFVVRCEKCGAEGPPVFRSAAYTNDFQWWEAVAKDCAEAWNRRAALVAADAEVERLTRALVIET